MIGLIFFLVYETGQGMPTSFVMQHHPEVLTLWMKVTFPVCVARQAVLIEKHRPPFL